MKSLSALHLYGATAIASFGVVLGRSLGWPADSFFWLWLSAALLVYNVDRLKNDPADRVNVPLRSERVDGLRPAGMVLVCLGSLGLVFFPVFTGNWTLLWLVVGGTLFCCGYSVPILGRRLKQIPVLKTVLAPSVVLLAWIVPPLLQFGVTTTWPGLLCTCSWVWTLLFFNMLLCDTRDLTGDAQTGVRSLPIVLGPKWTRRLLWTLVPVETFLGLCVLFAMPQVPLWRWLAPLAPISMAALLAALRKPRGESFYEWWVEGLLFLPALATLLAAR